MKRKTSTDCNTLNDILFSTGILIAVGIGIILGILIGMIFLFSLLICQMR